MMFELICFVVLAVALIVAKSCELQAEIMGAVREAKTWESLDSALILTAGTAAALLVASITWEIGWTVLPVALLFGLIPLMTVIALYKYVSALICHVRYTRPLRS